MTKIEVSFLSLVIMLNTAIPFKLDVSSSAFTNSVSQKVYKDFDITKINFDNEEEIVQLANLAKRKIEKFLKKVKKDGVVLEEKKLFTDMENFDYSTKPNDGMAALLNKYDGYNYFPNIVPNEELKKDTNLDEIYNLKYLEDHLGMNGLTFYRGLNAGYNSGLTVDKMISNFKHGEFWNGYGVTGNGTYFSPDFHIAARYAFPRWCTEEECKNGKIIQIKLAKDTKIISYNNLLKISEKYKIQNSEIENKVLSGNYILEDKIKRLYDVGHLAEVLGYDAIAVEDGEGNIWEFILLNRSKALVFEKDIRYEDYIVE